MNELRIDLRKQNPERLEKIKRTAELIFRFNNTPPFSKESENILQELFGIEGGGVHPPLYVNIADNIHIGHGVSINPYFKCMAAGNVFIEDGAMLAMGVSVITNNHDFYERNVITVKDVRICRNAWIGAGAIILSGVTVGQNAVVGAGSVVTRDVEANTVVAGNPARVIRTLDKTKLGGVIKTPAKL